MPWLVIEARLLNSCVGDHGLVFSVSFARLVRMCSYTEGAGLSIQIASIKHLSDALISHHFAALSRRPSRAVEQVLTLYERAVGFSTRFPWSFGHRHCLSDHGHFCL